MVASTVLPLKRTVRQRRNMLSGKVYIHPSIHSAELKMKEPLTFFSNIEERSILVAAEDRDIIF